MTEPSDGPVQPSWSPERAEAQIGKAMERAKALLALHERRNGEMDSQIFGDPAWDMLLYLFTQRVDGYQTTATMACDASRVPPTTALRYITILAAKKFISRRVAAHDSRVHHIDLSDDTYLTMIDVLGS